MDAPLIDYFTNCEDELAILTNGEDAHQRMKLEVLHVFDYIGDNYINDMQGAKNAGMKTIHFNRHHQTSGPLADHVVYSAKELVEFIKKD